MSVGMGSISRGPFELDEITDKEFTPLWSVEDFNDDKILLRWLNSTVEGCEDYYRSYFQNCLDNLLLYRGVQWLQQDRNANRRLDRQGMAVRRSPRVVINHLYDTVEQWVSRLTRYRPAVAIYPARPLQQDADDAKIASHVLDYVWYKNSIDKILQDFARQTKIFGEAYLFITWDPTRGDLAPDWTLEVEAAKKQGLSSPRVPVLGPDGNPVRTEAGDELFIDKAVRIGDVKYSLIPPWRVMPQPTTDKECIDWVITWEAQDVDYVRAKYPEQADKIKKNSGAPIFSNYVLDLAKMKNQVVVYTLHHRSSEFLDKGRFIKFTSEAILENTDLPYSHGRLPYLHLTDIDVPDQIRGMSSFQMLFPIQHQINACASLIYKALTLFAHPKWIIQEGSTDISQLLNECTCVAYSGGVPPRLENHPAVPVDAFNYLNKLEEVYNKLSGVFTMSRGTAPSGVRAAKALRVLEEQEEKRGFSMATKYNEIGLVENAKMTLGVCGDYYEDSDERLVSILGRDNSYRIKKFSQANLSKPYEIRVENTTALSKSPSARIDDITELSQVQVGPGSIVTKEQMINMLDLTASEEFKDVTTRAVKCAQTENDDILAGEQVAPPTVDEDLITHWTIHLQAVQSRDYKETMPPERKAALEQHVYITEYLMWKKAFGIMDAMGMPIVLGNMNFQAKMQAMCVDWPVYFQIPPPGVLPPMPGMGVSMAGGPAQGPMPVPQNPGIQPSPVDAGIPLGAGAPGIPAPVEETPPLV